MTISHHMPCKNKLDASKLSLQILRGFGLPRKEPILPTDKNHNVDSLVVSFHPFPGPSVANAISLMLEKLMRTSLLMLHPYPHQLHILDQLLELVHVN